jgi:hypothetical protein
MKPAASVPAKRGIARLTRWIGIVAAAWTAFFVIVFVPRVGAAARWPHGPGRTFRLPDGQRYACRASMMLKRPAGCMASTRKPAAVSS